jgi:hypothetical protein
MYILPTIIFAIHKVFMKPKMGRPKLPKGKVRGILILTRISQEENKVIEEAIRRSKLIKSEWTRKALLSVAGSDKSAS